MKLLLRTSLILLTLLASQVSAQEAPTLQVANLFSDNMVLQREAPIRVWGWDKPEVEVTVSLDSKVPATASTKAGEDGRWTVELPAIEATSEPFGLSVKSGTGEVKFQNLLAGDVWICSGQSNMEWTVNSSGNPKEEVANANYPLIRHVKIGRQPSTTPLKDAKNSKWQICSPETVGNFTAVGYYFGRELHKEVNIPIGLINSNWGGTPIEAWISGESLKSHPDYKIAVENMEANAAKNASGEGQKVGPNQPTALYNSMIDPLKPFSFKGVIWYQGESNAGRAHQYQTLKPLLINDWRKQWSTVESKNEFPFYWVQLANFRDPSPQPAGSDWAELREAQSMALSLPNTGQAVAIDIGNAKDIHPKNKQEVGRRLALNALAKDYGKKIEFSGPVYDSMEVEGSKIRLTFSHAEGLQAKGGELERFEIAGADQKFVWATAKIEGSNVIVSSEEVPAPVAVRYAWANNPDGCNLYNAADLPASPFRTDNWKGVTQR